MGVFPTENIILLEFLVDEVTFEPSLQKDLQTMRGETCVAFKFLDNKTLIICEQDAIKKKTCPDPCDKSCIKNGKSCLFSLTPGQTEQATRMFDIQVEVYKKMRPGTLPEKLPVGVTSIQVASLFKALMKDATSCAENTCVKTHKKRYTLKNTKGEQVGSVDVFVRLSCFGKLIVTQFQMNLENKSTEFKAKEGHYMFKYNKKDGRCPDGPPRLPCSSPSLCDVDVCKPPGEESCLPRPCGLPPPPPPPPCCQPQTCPPPVACPPPTPPPSCCQPSPCCQPPRCPGPPPPCCQPQPCYPPPPCCQPCPPPPCGNPCCMYAPPCPSPCYSPCCVPSPCYPPSPCCPPVSCCPSEPCPPPPCIPCLPPACAYPFDDEFQEIGATMGNNALTIRVHKDSCKVEPVGETEECGCVPFGETGPIKRKKVTCPSRPCCPLPPGSVCNPCCGPIPCAVQCDDPDKEIFVLRIGNKNDGSCGQKKNLEVELTTPKGIEIKPPPKKESRDAQYDARDFPNGYLEGFYGKDAWNKLQKAQAEQEAELAAMYGAYGVGPNPPELPEPKKKKGGKKGGDGGGKGGKGGKSGKGGGKSEKGGGKSEKGGGSVKNKAPKPGGGKEAAGGKDTAGDKENKRCKQVGVGGGPVFFDKNPPIQCRQIPCTPSYTTRSPCNPNPCMSFITCTVSNECCF